MKNTKPARKIEMAAFNPLTRKYEIVHPESEITPQEMTPLFFCQSAQQYVTVPGVSVESVWDEWIKQR